MSARTRLKSPAYLLLAALVCAAGCGWIHPRSQPGAVGPAGMIPPGLGPGPPMMQNPLSVPPLQEDYLWNQVVDTIDDYFKIQREDRVRVTGGVVSEGRIETFPETASGYLEPWKRDSTPGPEKKLATLQSIRRRALIRISPGPDGYQIHVTVLKELEDVSYPEFATVGGATRRHDGGVVRTSPGKTRGSVSLGWIPIGRDPGLEQQILFELQARLGNPPPSGPPGSHHGRHWRTPRRP